MKIASRYRPFSHQPGTALIVPGTTCMVRAYPTALFIQNEEGEDTHIEWALTGLVQDFTVMQDFERLRVTVSGKAQEGYFNYIIYAQDHHLILKLERAHMNPLKGVLHPLNKDCMLQPKEHIVLCSLKQKVKNFHSEKISFGNHKAQEWERVLVRKNPLEYFPFWFAAGQCTLQEEIKEFKGTLHYLQECRSFLDQGKEKLFLSKMEELFQVGFEGLLVPKLYDTQHLGVLSNKSALLDMKRPAQLLHEGYQLIRSMLFQEKGNSISILPHVPSAFHAGRCLNFKMQQATLSIEWSKKLLKKVIITSSASQTIHLNVQKVFKNFRVKSPSYSKGIKFSCGHPLQLEAGVYILDQFMK